MKKKKTKQPKAVLAWAWLDCSCGRYIVLHGDTLAEVRAVLPFGCEIVRVRTPKDAKP